MHMSRVAKFEKVSFEQFKKDWLDAFPNQFNDYSEDEINEIIYGIYDSIELPKRGTVDSAGYDFFCPARVIINPNETVKIPTGIKCRMSNGCVLLCFPRSSHGFKYGLHLANSVGVIDGDFYDNETNEGNIQIKLVNDSVLAKTITLNAGDAFCQGILMPYGITVDDVVDTVRVGGIGSTDK